MFSSYSPFSDSHTIIHTLDHIYKTRQPAATPADLFPDFITFCCNIMALIVFQLVTTIYWVVLGSASIKKCTFVLCIYERNIIGREQLVLLSSVKTVENIKKSNLLDVHR